MEHPGDREASALRRVAAELPRGRVRRAAVVGRCHNPYPLGEGVEAIPLTAIDRLLRGGQNSV